MSSNRPLYTYALVYRTLSALRLKHRHTVSSHAANRCKISTRLIPLNRPNGKDTCNCEALVILKLTSIQSNFMHIVQCREFHGCDPNLFATRRASSNEQNKTLDRFFWFSNPLAWTRAMPGGRVFCTSIAVCYCDTNTSEWEYFYGNRSFSCSICEEDSHSTNSTSTDWTVHPM